MKSGLVSVILPVWKPDINQLKACLDSLIKQTYSRIEIIIVYRKDDRFDSSFFQLIDNYQDNRIKIIDDEGKGFCNSLNAGILKSEGEYIARIDSDDFCDISRFEKQLKFKKENKCNVVGSWAYYLYDNNVPRKLQKPVTHDEIRRKMMLYNPIAHSAVLMDKIMLDQIGYYDQTLPGAEDYEMWFRALSKGYRFGNVPEYLITIRANMESVSRGSEWKKHRLWFIRVKNKAFSCYGFREPLDMFYYVIDVLTLLIPPTVALKARTVTGLYKK